MLANRHNDHKMVVFLYLQPNMIQFTAVKKALQALGQCSVWCKTCPAVNEMYTVKLLNAVQN